MNAAAPSSDPLQPRPAEGYAGDVTPELAFQWWQSGEAVLVDIRTDAERDWVGFVPGAINIEWKHWPGMQVRAEFDEDLRAAVPPGTRLVMLCRSGVRSVASSRRATELGYEAYNILEGFQGDPDPQGHRDTVGGWRRRGLPWRQG
jgi:rhodanese-related sulfurtransferase